MQRQDNNCLTTLTELPSPSIDGAWGICDLVVTNTLAHNESLSDDLPSATQLQRPDYNQDTDKLALTTWKGFSCMLTCCSATTYCFWVLAYLAHTWSLWNHVHTDRHGPIQSPDRCHRSYRCSPYTHPETLQCIATNLLIHWLLSRALKKTGLFAILAIQ